MKRTRPNFETKHKWFRSALLAGIVSLYLLLPDCGFALDSAKSLFQFHCQNWTRQNGLAADKISAVVQSQDGYIWLGTQNGLVRFDGLEFKIVPIDLPEAHGQDVRNLNASKDGEIRFAINNGGFGSYDGQKFFAIGNERWARPNMNAAAILEARDGAIWTGGDLGLGRWVNGQPAKSFFDETNGAIRSLCEDTAGRIWFGTSEHGLYYWAGGKSVQIPDDLLKKRNIFALAADSAGQIWVGTEYGLRCYAQGQPKAIPAFDTEVRALLVDRHGILWIGTSGMGLARYENGVFTYLKKVDGLGSDYVTSLFEDSEGSLWVGMRDGLSQLKDVKFPIYSSKEGISEGSSHSVFASVKGGLWITTADGLSYFDGKTAQNYTQASLLPNLYIKLGFESKRGDVYLIDGDKNIDVLSGDHLSARYANQNWPTAFAEDSESVLVSVGPGHALFRIQDGTLRPYKYKDGDVPDYYWINNLCVTKDGTIWVASNNGIFRVKDGHFKQWTMLDGLVDQNIEWIVQDVDGSIWAGSTRGITRIKDDKVKNIKQENGLYKERTFAMVPDERGAFWFDSTRGIFRASRQSLNDFADGKTNRIKCEVFNGLESVKSIDRTDQENSGCKTSDGRIWFPSPWGVVMIDPTHIPINRVTPPVHIDRVLVNARETARSQRVLIPLGKGDMEFDFTALSFIAPQKIRVRYQLEGYDKDWVEAGDRRMAFYTNLKPGGYTFHVIAANADGVWNQTGDSLNVKLLPHYYQTDWFYLLCGALVLAALGGIYVWRVRHLMRRHRALQNARDLLEVEVASRTTELAYERDLLRSLLESSPDPIYFKDLQSRFLKASKQLVKFNGVEGIDNLVGKTDFDFFAEEHARAAFEDEQEIIRTGLPLIGKVEKEVLNDGRETWALTSKMALRDKVGRIIGTFGISKDITAIKQVEAELAYERDLLRALLDNSPDQIYFKDLQSRFIKSSHAQAVNFGLQSASELIGKTDIDFFTEEHARPAFEDEQEIIRTGIPLIGKVEKEFWKDGRVTWVLTNKIPLRNKDGLVIGTFGISKDITAIKESEIQLEQVHKQLLATSRQAGMAEIATNVLHNVGNVLNSVNVSASVVMDSVKKSKASSLAKVVALLREHEQDLGFFFTTDPRGKQLSTYLAQLSEQLLADQKTTVHELNSLVKNIDHIKEVVAMQQSYARVSGVKEIINVRELVEDSLRMNAGALDRHRVAVNREFSDVPLINIDKHKALQILVNLIRNSKHACQDSERADKQLTVRVADGDGRIKISVIDNGVGIPPENLTRIFNHGFTTRKDGHGFGLHNGALAAKEMGGTLTVHSEGPGKGATFTLELPCAKN